MQNIISFSKRKGRARRLTLRTLAHGVLKGVYCKSRRNIKTGDKEVDILLKLYRENNNLSPVIKKILDKKRKTNKNIPLV